ncbi:MAG TPA: crosslink repair DNA glycosylase YcaQ family protein [Candidatus Angelobacter sp.]
MTEQDLQQRRAEIWRTNGNPVRTIEDAKGFLDSVGLCLMYPVRALPAVPTFLGACAGSATGVPDARHAFADPRTQPALDLMVRLHRSREAYEVNLLPESSLLVSAPLFPSVYALIGDRKPKAPPKTKAHGAKLSPLAHKVFDVIQERGLLSTGQLREIISGEPSAAALERALNELWSILKITRVDYREKKGVYWDLLYRWAPEAVMEGVGISLPEALSELIGKYLEAVEAASQEELEQFFSYLVPGSKVREAIHALLAARQLALVTVGAKTLIHLAPLADDARRRNHG